MDEFDYDEKPGLEGEAKEEPDCYSCSDRGCPECGYVDPQDPEHQKWMAEQIIQGRVQLPQLTAATTKAERDEVIVGLPDVELSSLDAIDALIKSARVTVLVEWPEQTVLPF